MSMVKYTVLFLLLMAFIGAPSLLAANANPDTVLTISVASSKKTYNYREPISLIGNFVQNGVPVTNGTVGIAVYDSSSLPIAFRIAKTGSTMLSSLVRVIEIAPCSETGITLTSLMPLQTLWVKFTLKNFDLVDHFQYTTITIFDANGIPLATRLASSGPIRAGASGPTIFNANWVVPVSTQPGNATIVACVFTDSPKDGGVPYGEEKKVNFEIKRNPEIDYTAPPMTDPSAPAGSFASSLKLTNELKPGDYQVFVTARSTFTNGTQQSMLTVQNTTQFSIVNVIMPPQAAFTYYPVDSYVNMSITFDASASTAEGYNVQIVNFEWDFGDGTPKVQKTTPLATHTYTVVNNYTVTLNVTDSQGLWSYTSKLIVILPPAGPQTSFIWYPATPRKNQQVTFDATSTKLGWNGTDHPPITNYIWDFGDGNVTSGLFNKTVHTFITEGNYTVKLNVTDASGYKGYVSHIVMVKVSGILGDINGDGTVDIYDAILLSGAYNSVPGSPNWNPNADINSDNIVDIYDAIILANHYGETG